MTCITGTRNGIIDFSPRYGDHKQGKIKEERGKQIQGCGWEQLQGLSLPIVRNIIGTGAFKHLFSFWQTNRTKKEKTEKMKMKIMNSNLNQAICLTFGVNLFFFFNK
jgi:hypothetical protein